MKKLIAIVLAVSCFCEGLRTVSFAADPTKETTLTAFSEATPEVTPQHNEETTEQELARYFKELKEKYDQIKSKREKRRFIKRELKTIETKIEYYNKLEKISKDAEEKEHYSKKISSLAAKKSFLNGNLEQIRSLWDEWVPTLGACAGVFAVDMLARFTCNRRVTFFDGVIIESLLEQAISACL